MKLLIGAQQIAGFPRAVPFGLREESHVQGRSLEFPDGRSARTEQNTPCLIFVGTRRDQKFAARYRRERHAGLELGIIASTRALEGVRPTVVENIFALRMILEIERQETFDAVVALDRQ